MAAGEDKDSFCPFQGEHLPIRESLGRIDANLETISDFMNNNRTAHETFYTKINALEITMIKQAARSGAKWGGIIAAAVTGIPQLIKLFK